MVRSFSRRAALIGGASVVALFAAGCASTAPGGADIGVPGPATSAQPKPSGDALAGMELAISNELNAVNSTQNAGESPQALLLLTALNSPSSLQRAETFTSLLALGSKAATQREQVVLALLAEVGRNSYIQGVTIGGTSLSASLTSILNGVNGQLATLANTVATATLTDVARTTLISINASTRVYGLIEPMVHLALAGGVEIAEVNALATHAQHLANQVEAAGASGDPHYLTDLALLRDLTARLATARQIADSAVSTVLGLKASGFPANKATITAARAALLQLRSPGGALGIAQGDVGVLVTNLGLGA
jgi:hypothetical protein